MLNHKIEIEKYCNKINPNRVKSCFLFYALVKIYRRATAYEQFFPEENNLKGEQRVLPYSTVLSSRWLAHVDGCLGR